MTRSRKVWLRSANGLVCAAATLLCSCSIREDQPLLVAFDEEILTLDPHLHNHSVTWSVLMNLYDGLVRFSPEMRLEPCLAEKWEKVDGTHWRLWLREGVRFSDGSSFDAGDVVASFERARSHPRSLVRHFLVGVSSMRAESDHVVTVETEGPAPDLLNRLAFLFVVPKEMAGEAEIVKPTGTGPYRLVERRFDGDVVLEGWQSWRGRPQIREVRFSFFPEEYQATRRFLNGGADIVRRPPTDLTAEIERQKHLRLMPQPRLGVQLAAIIPSAPGGLAGDALVDPRVRRALLLALDRESWVGRIYRGSGTVASQYVHPVVFGYDPAIRPVAWSPVQASELLAQAGYANGLEIKLVHATDRSGFIEAMQEDLAKVGVRVTALAMSYPEALALARAREVDMFVFGWVCSTGDASDYLNSSVHTPDPDRGLGIENYGRFSEPAIDELLERADRELSVDKRLGLLQQAQRATLDQLPVLPLTIRWGFVGASDRVEVRTRHDERIWVFDYRWRR